MSDRPGRRARALLKSVPLRATVFAACLLLAIGLVLTGTAVEVSSRPAFCGSCHIMAPYYESWKQSTHRNIACVECHIPPGVTAEIRKKYEALSMVARYFTGTYGTNPWTEIDDAACLRCHERRLLVGREKFGDILFDHGVHLAGMRRGKTLRCTSCHSQIVQGSHIAVTASTCLLCHFKGQASGAGTARCTLCHTVPEKVVRRGTLTFNHGEVSRFGMDCTWCHARPADSDGPVPRERCVTCHNQPDRLQKFTDITFLHQMHVTEHKVDCMDCHLEIKHVAPPHVETAATSTCSSCHELGHSLQAELYTGVGGRGVDPMPNPMFLAGVRCEGCHIALPGEVTTVRRASDVACMSCHGPAYRSIYLAWQAGLKERTTALDRQIRDTGAALGRAVPPGLADARFNLDLVRRARGVHNIDYAYTLLARAHDDLNAARRASGLPALPRPWREAPYESPCLRCHQGVEAQTGIIFDRSFRHEAHVARARVGCESCHRPHEERARGEVVRFDASGCEGCHHRDVARAGTDCLSCHAAIRARVVKSARGGFSHAFHLDEAGQTCTDCHDVSPGKPVLLKDETCAGCHGE